MRKDYVFISNQQWFESCALKNPIVSLDYKLKKDYPDYFSLNYDTKLLASRAPTSELIGMPFYNDYLEKYGKSSTYEMDSVLRSKNSKYVFLNGFRQEHFEYVVPHIQETTEVLYLFKCPKIKDLSSLSKFKNLECLHIFWNNSIESLWDMTNNTKLKILSFITITKLKNIENLRKTSVEYINFDSSDNSDRKKPMLFEREVFDDMPNLKHLSLYYTKCKVDY